jgi:hypothetical protein
VPYNPDKWNRKKLPPPRTAAHELLRSWSPFANASAARQRQVQWPAPLFAMLDDVIARVERSSFQGGFDLVLP